MGEREITVEHDEITGGAYTIRVASLNSHDKLRKAISNYRITLFSSTPEIGNQTLLKGVLIQEPTGYSIAFTDRANASHTYMTRRVLGKTERGDHEIYQGQFLLHKSNLTIWGRTENDAGLLLNAIVDAMPEGVNFPTRVIINKSFNTPQIGTARGLSVFFKPR